MCTDSEFDPETSHLVYGPINKPRWIYACSKQLMDRVISGYGMEQGLNYTLFRPFNWIGPGLDSIFTTKEGSSRVVTQFLGHIVRGEPIQLVDGGRQKRAFTDIDDGIAALMAIIEEPGRHRHGQDLQHRQSGQPLVGARARRDDARAGRRLPRIRRRRGRLAASSRPRPGLLRHRLPGRAEPRAEDRRHDRRSRLEARSSTWTSRCARSSSRTASKVAEARSLTTESS